MKILLLGCNGQVGWELQRSLAPLGDVIACDFDSATDRRADFAKPAAVGELIDRIQPQVIVNAAAHTAVDKAESEIDLSRTINAVTPGVIADRARALGALVVHYSTDYVFDGSGDQARDELAVTGPLSVYGKTKLEGEERIRASGCRHLINLGIRNNRLCINEDVAATSRNKGCEVVGLHGSSSCAGRR